MLGKDLVLTEALPLYRRLSSDDQDSVRLLTVEDLVAISEELSNEEVAAYMLQSIRNSVGDKSWRVRYMAADNFVKLATAVGQEIVRSELVVVFLHLLQDNEAEVRTAGTSQIPGFAKLINDPTVVLTRIFPVVRELAGDSSQHVRAILALQVPGLAPLLGREATIEHLLPIFLALLKDEYPDVRLHIISKLDQVNEGTLLPQPLLFTSFYVSLSPHLVFVFLFLFFWFFASSSKAFFFSTAKPGNVVRRTRDEMRLLTGRTCGWNICISDLFQWPGCSDWNRPAITVFAPSDCGPRR